MWTNGPGLKLSVTTDLSLVLATKREDSGRGHTATSQLGELLLLRSRGCALGARPGRHPCGLQHSREAMLPGAQPVSRHHSCDCRCQACLSHTLLTGSALGT